MQEKWYSNGVLTDFSPTDNFARMTATQLNAEITKLSYLNTAEVTGFSQ